RLRGIIAEHQIKKLVVGLPRNMNGGIGPQAVSVLAFIEVLKTRLQIDVIPWDERLTTAEAERALISADLSREKRRKKIDQVAAVLILQGYLDYRRLAHTAEYTKPDNS
ncbi:MAG TPA: Holliday junction resolvase RuvX, partial [Nitrospiria bacterium]